jgi:hypothetical protein
LYQQAVGLVPEEPPSAARAQVLAGKAHMLFMLSRPAAALAASRRALAIGMMPSVGALFARLWRVLLDVGRGDLAAAARLLDEVERV